MQTHQRNLLGDRSSLHNMQIHIVICSHKYELGPRVIAEGELSVTLLLCRHKAGRRLSSFHTALQR